MTTRPNARQPATLPWAALISRPTPLRRRRQFLAAYFGGTRERLCHHHAIAVTSCRGRPDGRQQHRECRRTGRELIHVTQRTAQRLGRRRTFSEPVRLLWANTLEPLEAEDKYHSGGDICRGTCLAPPNKTRLAPPSVPLGVPTRVIRQPLRVRRTQRAVTNAGRRYPPQQRRIFCASERPPPATPPALYVTTPGSAWIGDGQPQTGVCTLLVVRRGRHTVTALPRRRPVSHRQISAAPRTN